MRNKYASINAASARVRLSRLLGPILGGVTAVGCASAGSMEDASAMQALLTERAVTCRIEAPATFLPSVGRSTTMETSGDGQWCGFWVHINEREARTTASSNGADLTRRFQSYEMAEAPRHGDVRFFSSQQRTYVLYRGNPGYTGTDRFVFQLYPGGGYYPVAVNVTRPARVAPLPSPVLALFDVNSSTLGAEWVRSLDTFLADLRAAIGAQPGEPIRLPPGYTIRVSGYADPRGSAEHNRRLSLSRAEAVRMHLMSRGVVDPSRIEVESFGDTRPVDLRDPSASINRRVEVSIVEASPSLLRTISSVRGARL
jgi:outer membrane protein OmpA-like peptidoglycan-associated protein